MQQRRHLLYATICVFIWTTQWADVISTTVSSGEILLKDKLSTESEIEHDKNNNGKNGDADDDGNIEAVNASNELFYSDELMSDEYEDDLDADYKMQRRQQQQQNDHEWDVLIFTQQWPATSCYHWREEDKSNICLLPTRKNLWTIHGIWPTKFGHIGPTFCNKSAEFNLTVLQPIEDPLNEYWPTIEGGPDHQSDGLWKHEWLKHGTCATMLNELNDEYKYFSQGLDWLNQYQLSDILASAGIQPDSNNTVIALHTALLKTLGKKPSIHCEYDNKNAVSYLLEIRICFDKALQLTDCDGVPLGDAVSIDYPGGTVNTNCHISKPVNYPSNVPPVQSLKQDGEWQFPVVNMYKLLQFIMWFTL